MNTAMNAATNTVLIVEDDPTFARAIETHLTRAGFDVETAADTRVALEKADARRFDMLVVDLAMPPGMPGGLTFARMVRSRQPRTHVIFLTGYADLADAVPRFSGKVFIKPVVLDEIVSEIRAQLARETA